ncbi:iron-sulfur cluster carrier protein [Vibrio sp. MACH09]|uniref:iron-sulfur cluster carrier protein ApbC n=1 Tax=unclassified Vibrio TaxID=2614977 RepID=UPI001493B626|nr:MULTISPECIES: iron-sulfur cluster carrier protein ApbC [unclassified Vibrio]NOI66399.1 iron-sulfur cluster carrier protein ApbC [Vibrio sp. 99-8-1]GLO60380.1 iron-sulfur cluster carrier protein [Vibrio sp. MACH09]
MATFDSKQTLCHWLNQFQHPLLIENWSEHDGVVKLLKSGEILISIPFVSNSLMESLQHWLDSQAEDSSSIRLVTDVVAMETQVKSELATVKNVIAVTSAKGGVGKSTSAVNLALALKAQGASVGLLDADIYGPSVPMMLGKEDQTPDVRDSQYMIPIESFGLHTNSIGYLVDKSEAAIWRGPMASKALGQLLNETDWPELDYLVIDMPPGTGDVQLTLSQNIPVTGAIIVTTPQDLALADVRKGLAMFDKVDVPVLGIVENMSYHICSHCGEKEHIFGSNGAAKMAKEFSAKLLAQVPLHISMREDIDKGKPTVVSRPDSEHSHIYMALAEQIASQLFWTGKAKPVRIPLTDLS